MSQTLHNKKDIFSQLIPEDDHYDGGSQEVKDTPLEKEVRDKVLKIESLKEKIEQEDAQDESAKSKFERFFPKREEQMTVKNTQDTIVKIFGHQNFQTGQTENDKKKGGLSLNTIITYGQFSRIDNEIDEKNQRVSRLIELHWFNCAMSFLVIWVFQIKIIFHSPTYWNFHKSHFTSKSLFAIKFGIQEIFKLAILCKLLNIKKTEVKKLVIEKSHVTFLKTWYFFDTLLEVFALGLLSLLRKDIYVAEKAKDADEVVADKDEEFFQADIFWAVAFLSILFAAFYNMYLYRKMSKDMDQCDYYNKQDQKTYDNIVKDHPHLKDDNNIIRRLTSFELDQLFNEFGPLQISNFVKDFSSKEEIEKGRKALQEKLDELSQN